MTKKKIFLASSSELKEDRKEFEIFINRKNKDWVAQGTFIELVVWEDFLDAVSKTRLQDEYNKAIRECDIFVMLFFTKVGQYTEEEFKTAFGQFKATSKPFIFTYFKDAKISTGSASKMDLMSLWAFQDKLKALGHFYTVYKNIDELKFKFNQQLDKLAADGFVELKPDKGEVAPPNGINICGSKNVIAGSKLDTSGGDVIVGDRNTTNNMLDLFTIMLPAAISSVTDWATKKLLDVVTECPGCNSPNERVISNCASNNLACPTCMNKLDQYSIATPTTVKNGRLMGANIFNPHWEGQSEGRIFKRLARNWFLLDVSTVSMQHHGMVIKAIFRDVRTKKKWDAQEIYLNNNREREIHFRMGWSFSAHTFTPNQTIVSEVQVMTLDGDVLHSIAPLATFTAVR